MHERTHWFFGISGRSYEYYLPPRPIPHAAGNYIFATPLPRGNWEVLYVGESRDLRKRLAINRHEKWNESSRLVYPRKIYILYGLNRAGDFIRRREERDLILNFNPPCNVEFNFSWPEFRRSAWVT